MANFCPNCGAPIAAGTTFCPNCGSSVNVSMANNPFNAVNQPQQNYVYDSADQPVQPRNGIATAGFVLSLIGLIFCWFPIVNGLLVIPGLIMSIVGVCRQPRGKAIAGIIMACVAILIFIILASSVREYQRMFG